MAELIAWMTAFFGMLILVMLFSLIFIKVGWLLFMVPVFGVPNITWLQALGFSFLAAAFRSSNVNKKS